MKRILTVAFAILDCGPVFSGAAWSENGVLKVTSFPSSAAVDIDGFEEVNDVS